MHIVICPFCQALIFLWMAFSFQKLACSTSLPPNQAKLYSEHQKKPLPIHLGCHMVGGVDGGGSSSQPLIRHPGVKRLLGKLQHVPSFIQPKTSSASEFNISKSEYPSPHATR